MKLDLQNAITEKEWTAQIKDLALLYGYKFYHPYLSIRSEWGFPDCVLVHAGQRRVIFAELKSQRGKLTVDQQEWIDALRAAGQEVYVWRPSDWDEIVEVLK